MRKRRWPIVILAAALIIIVIGALALYLLGDRVFDEVIDNQIEEMEKAMEQPAPAEAAPTPGEGVAIEVTKEKLQEIKESVTPTDKMTAAKIVLSELNQSDVNQLTKLASGGITAEEKAEIKSIVYSRLTEQEIEEVKAMYYKYMK